MTLTYRLKIIALDGGTPPRTGTLTVNVNVQVSNMLLGILAHESCA